MNLMVLDIFSLTAIGLNGLKRVRTCIFVNAKYVCVCVCVCVCACACVSRRDKSDNAFCKYKYKFEGRIVVHSIKIYNTICDQIVDDDVTLTKMVTGTAHRYFNTI